MSIVAVLVILNNGGKSMGVAYRGIGGIGIEVTNSVIHAAIESGVFTEDEWADCEETCMEKFDIDYEQGGNCWTGGSQYYYFLVDGYNLTDINKNSEEFINKLSKFGVKLKIDDLVVISDYLVY